MESKNYLYQCQCGCHQKGSHVMHIMPCCEECKICGQHIKFGCMEDHSKERHPNLVIDQSLIDALNQDAKWQIAFTAAKLVHGCIISLVDGVKISQDYKFINDFVQKCGSKNKNKFNGRISVKNVFDEPAVLLEVEFKQSAKKVKRLEIVFHEIGVILHAAIA